MQVTNTSDEPVRMRGGIAIGPGRTAEVPVEAVQHYTRSHPNAAAYLKVRPSAPPKATRRTYRSRRR